MGLILFAKKFINFVYGDKHCGIEYTECELERQGLGEQKDEIIELVYSLYKQGKSKEETLAYIMI
jgi:hypothetical protein